MRGREAHLPGSYEALCLNLEQVKLATDTGQNVVSTCCKRKEHTCERYYECGYMRQFENEQPQVWIGAHQLLCHEQKQIGEFEAIIIDESFWNAGIEIWNNPIKINDLELPPRGATADFGQLITDMRASRAALVSALRRHPNGALEAKFFDTLTPQS